MIVLHVWPVDHLKPQGHFIQGHTVRRRTFYLSKLFLDCLIWVSIFFLLVKCSCKIYFSSPPLSPSLSFSRSLFSCTAMRWTCVNSEFLFSQSSFTQSISYLTIKLKSYCLAFNDCINVTIWRVCRGSKL